MGDTLLPHIISVAEPPPTQLTVTVNAPYSAAGKTVTTVTLPSYNTKHKYYATHEEAVNGDHYHITRDATAPRFIRYLGMEAPKTTEIKKRSDKPRNDLSLPLHAKPVDGAIDLGALLRMARAQLATPLLSALRWLYDESLYTQLLLHKIARQGGCSLTDDDLDILISLERYEEISDAEAAAFCRAFTVDETSKNRRRHILEPLINDLVCGSGEIELPTKTTIRAGLKRYTILLDAASFYDQFKLDPKVRRFFCVNSRKGYLQYTTLPMGFRKSCTIAHLTAQLLIDFAAPNVYKTAYIDNFLFSADKKEDVLSAVTTFRQRCAAIGVVLNEGDGDDRALIKQKFDFLGVAYDCSDDCLENWSSSNTEKTLSKIDLVNSLLDDDKLSWRQQAACFGVLFFAESVAPLRGAGLSSFFDALAHLRQNIAKTTTWNARAAPFSHQAIGQLREWCRLALLNEAVFFKRPSSGQINDANSTVLYVDASATGWGCIARTCTGIYSYAGKWSVADHQDFNLLSSVTAEPLALRRAVFAVTSTLRPTSNITAFVDHLGLFYAFQRGHSRVRAYNECVQIVKDMCASPISVFFVAGISNEADALSRRIWASTEDAYFTSG